MNSFFSKIASFMQGRYGNDKLNLLLLILTFLLYFINIFVRNVFLLLAALLIFALYIFRAFSRNITKRMYENRIFEKVCLSVTRFFRLQFKKIKEIKTHRYFKCPYCKAQLRVRRRTGTHPVRCPMCKQEFKKTIII